MTRTALVSPDDPNDPNCEAAFTHYYSTAVEAAFAEHRSSSWSLDKVIFADDAFKGIDFIHTDGSGKVMLVQAKRWSPPAKRLRHAWISPQRLAGLAVFIAGRERAAVGHEWCAHLSGETGVGLPQSRQQLAAAGFVLAAVCYRLEDAADLAWRPVETVLGSRELSSLVVLAATLGMSVVFICSGGFYNLCINFQNVAAVWVATYGLIRLGRWWRDVKPPEHKPRRGKKLPWPTLTSSRVTTLGAQRCDLRRCRLRRAESGRVNSFSR